MTNKYGSESFAWEYRDLQATTMSLDRGGQIALLAGRKYLAVIGLNLSTPDKVLVRIPFGGKYDISSTQWSQLDNTNIVAVASSQRCDIFELRDGAELKCLHRLKCHTRVITDLDWSTLQPSILATSSFDSFVHVWDIRCPRQALIEKPQVSLSALDGASQVKWNKWTSDILASCDGGHVKIWDLRKPTSPTEYIAAHASKINGLEWACQDMVITAAQDCTVKFSRVAAQNPTKAKGPCLSLTAPVWRARPSPFGRGIVTQCVPILRRDSGLLSLWDWKRFSSPIFTFQAHDIVEFAWRRSTNYDLLTWSRDQTLRIWALPKEIIELCGEDWQNNFQSPLNTSNEEGGIETGLELTEDDESQLSPKSQRAAPTKGERSLERSRKSKSHSSVLSERDEILKKEFEQVEAAKPENVIFDQAEVERGLLRFSWKTDPKTRSIAIVILASFPFSYPSAAPTFLVTSGGNEVDKNQILKSLKQTSQQYAKKNEPCLNACINQFSTFMKLIKPFEEEDNFAAFPSRGVSNVPFPRTSGARFCSVGVLVCFGRPSYLKRVKSNCDAGTPRSLSALGPFLSQVAHDNEDTIMRSSRRSRRQERKKAGVVTIFDVTTLLPFCKELASSYRHVVPYQTLRKSACVTNAQASLNFKRISTSNAWQAATIIANFTNSEVTPQISNSFHMEMSDEEEDINWIAFHPLGSDLVHSMITHYASHGDVQTAATLSCIFTVPTSKVAKQNPSNQSGHLLVLNNCNSNQQPGVYQQNSNQNGYNSSNKAGLFPCNKNQTLKQPGLISPYHTVHGSDTLHGVMVNPLSDTFFRQHRSNSWSDSLDDIKVHHPVVQSQLDVMHTNGNVGMLGALSGISNVMENALALINGNGTGIDENKEDSLSLVSTSVHRNLIPRGFILDPELNCNFLWLESLNIPHRNLPSRSLPDIPISDPNQLDTNSDLYATVGDKVGDKPQGQSPSSSAKKQISVPQHSSISQADDCSSPYARVRSPSHAYDKVRPAEHPYAQVKSIGDNGNRPSTSTAAIANNNLNAENNNPNENDSLSRRSSRESLLDSVDGRNQQVIPAASAIAGRVSASQELPYMTPPIVQPQQYFSGDSQDSSKGYTSISVREPLANIIAQTKKQNAQNRRREISDSHYATVSDDSDEMYAAIEDPNNPVELYTSGSETYAQIQPQEPMVVSVEINPVPSHTNNTTPTQPIPPLAPHPVASQSNSLTSNTPRNSINEATVEMLKAAHSRQASSSSCTSSVGNLGSPMPEKRQANSPLPPTPKGTHHYQSNTSLTNPHNSLQSGRSSAASVIEVAPNQRPASRENLSASMESRHLLRPNLHGGEDEPRKNRLSKDLEGMYAKVMKKNKLSSAPSENTSPVPFRKVLNEQQQRQISVFLSDPDIAHEINLPESLSKTMLASPGKNSVKSAQLNEDNNYETIDKRRARSSNSNYDSKNDPGYETIPADLGNNVTNKANGNRNSSHVPTTSGMLLQKLSQQSLNASFPANYEAGGDGSEPGYESLPDQSSNDPGYETVEQKNIAKKDGSDYDPNYETLRPTLKLETVDHYAKVMNKSKVDSNDGYSSIKSVKNTIISNEEDEQLGHCTISEDRVPVTGSVKNHDYASIRDTTKDLSLEENVYSSITNDMEQDLRIPNKGKSHSLASSPSPIPLSPNTPAMSMTSDTKTLTSPSSEGESSTNTPICYNSLRSTDRSQLTVSVSNYESLTGSESDSNYESVRYLNAQDRENPYEQLYNESDIKYDTLKCSSLKRDDTAGSLYSASAKNIDYSKNSSLSSSSGSRLGGRSSSSLNNSSEAAS